MYNNEYSPSAQPSEGKGMAIAALILGIISLICCFFVNFLTAPIALILGIIVIAKHKGGKGLAVAGIIMSIISLLLSALIWVSSKSMIEGMIDLQMNAQEYVDEYEDKGEIPDFLLDIEEKLGEDQFDAQEFMDSFVDSYNNASE